MNLFQRLFAFSFAATVALGSTSPGTAGNADPAGPGNPTTNSVNNANTTQNDAVNPGSTTFTDTTSVYPRRATTARVQRKAAERAPRDHKSNADTRQSRNGSNE